MRTSLWRCLSSPRGRGAVDGQEGQSTLEYLLVTLGVVAVIVALSALVDAVGEGAFSDLASRALSHSIGGTNALDGMLDVLLY